MLTFAVFMSTAVQNLSLYYHYQGLGHKLAITAIEFKATQ